MNKTFAIATLIAAASALQLQANDHSCEEEIEIYEDMAPITPTDSNLLLAQTGQAVTRACSETFAKIQNLGLSVSSTIAAGLPWSDPNFDFQTAFFNLS